MRTVLLFLVLLYTTTASSLEGVIVKVVDGDTIKIKYNGVTQNYRLAGIDTPETYNNSKAKKDIKECGISKELMFKLGKKATYRVKKEYKINQKIHFTIIDIGKYGRPIIWVPMLNDRLVLEGYARVVDYKNLNKYTINKLKHFQEQAMLKDLGIWKYLDCWR